MHRDQGDPQAKGHRLGKAEAHQHRADEAGGIAGRHGVDVLTGTSCLLQSLFRQGRDALHMLAGGNLRHHAAIQSMKVRLRRNGIGQHLAAILHHRHGGLIASRFKC